MADTPLSSYPDRVLTRVLGHDAANNVGKAVAAMLQVEDQVLAGGASVTAKNLGTKSSGSVAPDPGDRPLQFYTNGGAHTLAAPSVDGSCVVLITNNATAGAITFSGFAVGASVGDSLTTTNAHKFSIHIWRINGVPGYRVAAHQ